ncbi:GntR family transcriptional regulator [Jatrophihabitans sp. GAS493]|uniref:FadR/GntR family transcriptional regulator n=1 Tax=Jatrophihabitans sp. GAS493 TaxID=1907575 RepID=UPI000BC0D6E1|nr:FCD domain-containing protein [Jatrophihabitans sp. GAS493]SOD71786.1 GntR family transcriptional regulator [Jatrophihabitans sp. GAS493]
MPPAGTTANNVADMGRVTSRRRTEKIAETVARQILRDIKRQDLQAGAMLPPESVMLERFDIGRGSLREALRILEVNGLVTIKTGPGGGPIVASMDPQNFGQMSTLHLQSIGATYRQLLEARTEYEALLARMAAQQPGNEAAERVRAAMERGKEPTTDDSTYAAVTSGFHATVCDAGGNPVIALAAKSIQSIWSQRVTTVLFSAEDRPEVIHQHEAITKAIEKHDARRADKLMREHMEHYQQYCEIRYPARMDDVVDWS